MNDRFSIVLVRSCNSVRVYRRFTQYDVFKHAVFRFRVFACKRARADGKRPKKRTGVRVCVCERCRHRVEWKLRVAEPNKSRARGGNNQTKHCSRDTLYIIYLNAAVVKRLNGYE